MIRIKKPQYLVLILSWMLFIFYFSDQNAYDSQALSNGFLELFFGMISKLFNGNLDYMISPASFFIRKSAHFILYSCLGFTVMLSVADDQCLSLKNSIIMVVFCLCIFYAVFDEFHQAFIPGRSGEVRDVCIDAFGALLGIFCAKFVKKHFL